MRRVQVSKMEKAEGKNYYEPKVIGEANFHEWGCEFEEFESGPGNFSTAIVEFDDGTVKNVPVELIQFIDTRPF